ncbi:hypothetical protein [Streptomyces sp. WG7]|uniref:hypothetical protein n=1 Tax=Streptomyces sp. WG7 TaxID=3417650 RepID=UPI003CF24C79
MSNRGGGARTVPLASTAVGAEVFRTLVETGVTVRGDAEHDRAAATHGDQPDRQQSTARYRLMARWGRPVDLCACAGLSLEGL